MARCTRSRYIAALIALRLKRLQLDQRARHALRAWQAGLRRNERLGDGQRAAPLPPSQIRWPVLEERLGSLFVEVDMQTGMVRSPSRITLRLNSTVQPALTVGFPSNDDCGPMGGALARPRDQSGKSLARAAP
jgi:hypothetical protein